MQAKLSSSSPTCPRRSETPRSPSRLERLLALLPLLTLAACQTTGSGGTEAATFCQAARAIYWSRHDTAPTIEQIKEHNAVGLALRCGWKGAKGK
jgi:hypothetical protein